MDFIRPFILRRGVRLRWVRGLILMLLPCILAACGSSIDGPGRVTIAGRALLLNGPSVAAPPSGNTVVMQRSGSLLSSHDDPRWTLSPDQARITILSLNFLTAGGGGESVALSNCNVTYLRASPTLSQFLDCPFQVRAGTYVGVGAIINSAFSILIDDAEGGFFSDPAAPTRLSRTRPTGGAQFITFTTPQATTSNQVLFARPLVVDSATARTGLTIGLVLDGIHTVFVNVKNGAATLDEIQLLPPILVIPFVGVPGRAEFYTSTGTARTALLGGPSSVDFNSVRVYRDAFGVPIYLWSVGSTLPPLPITGLPASAWNASPATSPIFSGNMRAGGFLGLDSSGTLCWAVPTDYTYGTYAQLRSIRPQSTIGSTTTLTIQQSPNVPAPTSGDTYASGCPALTGQQSTLTLVAK